MTVCTGCQHGFGSAGGQVMDKLEYIRLLNEASIDDLTKFRPVSQQKPHEEDHQNINLIKNFKVLKKCRSKLDCLIYEMLWIKNKGPKLNTQTDSIRAKLFT